MNILTGSIRREREYGEILRTVTEQARSAKPLPLDVSGLCDGARFAFYAALCEDLKKLCGRCFLIVVPDEKEALRLSNAFADAGFAALTYPLRDLVFHNITASHEFEHERLSVLSAIAADACDVVITTPDAALQYTIPRETLAASTMRVKYDESCGLDRLVAFLADSGYARVELVDGVGQYSLRGGILDVFPPRSEYPVRIDFFGDEIEQLGIFDIMTQRRIENVKSFDITPAREVLVTGEKRGELKKAVLAQLKRAKDEKVKEQLAAELDALENGMELASADKYLPLIYPERACLFDYFDNSPLTVFQESNALSERLKSFEWHMKETVTALLEEGTVASKLADYNKWAADFEYYAESRPSMNVDIFSAGRSGRQLSGSFSFATKQTVSYADNLPLLCEELISYKKLGFSALLLCENDAVAGNLRAALTEAGIASVFTDGDVFTEDVPNITSGKNFAGYELTVTRFVCLSLFANPNSLSRTVRESARKRSKKSAREKIMSYADLEIGDYVVHANHGIGQYLGLESLTVENTTRDFVKIRYSGTAMLYLPTNQLDMVSKYIGARGEDGSVKLSRMGGTDWVKAKQRAKKAARDMAKELIKLYAERLKKEGFAFSPDDDLQRAFDAAFEYEETDGQLTAIADIKSDMESRHPMDRLLCGDVGFGKTEVALRAAFKAVSSSKQVALLVPTTILAMQHFQTLVSRMRGFPVKVDMLSRFRNPKQQQETLRRLRRGDIDIIVGTHRVVSNDVQFKDLGLVIVDEEQRFGVAQKEKLKQIASNVDVLTLTATPIPRTLNMAMSGIRDMSVLEEAPGDRLPVQTYVLEYEPVILADAINRELRRGGQVFYLYNRVETIDQAAAAVKKMAPDARVAMAHGQMDKEQLSDIWRALVVGDLDILVSTTIIETGVDVPNANTLIIEDADRMGLSQLHQIRGRVGRSSRRAYAYLTYRRGKVLSEVAAKRLSAIRDFTEFGSGFKVAMRDLEIRGAGNLLGAEQHGYIESVGYDLYMKILNEAIVEEKGGAVETKTDCSVDFKCDAFIPEKYVRSSTQRIDAYKKVASIENEEDLRDITDELLDRYGEPPLPVMNLLRISLARGLACACGLNKLEQHEGTLLFYPANINIDIWTRLAAEYRGRLLMNLSSKPYISCRLKKGELPLELSAAVLKKYLEMKAEPNENK